MKGKGFHENYHILEPWNPESSYSTSRCFAPSSKLAWCKVELYSSLWFACESKLSTWVATGFRQGSNKLSLQTPPEVFRHYEMNYAEIARRCCTDGDSWAMLSIDRTEWQFEIAPSTFWCWCMKGLFPLVWCLLDKRGIPIVWTHEVVQPIPRTFWEREVACLTADREFVGKDWFAICLVNHSPLFGSHRENYKLNDGPESQSWSLQIYNLDKPKFASSTMLMGILAVHCCLAIRWRFSGCCNTNSTHISNHWLCQKMELRRFSAF